MEAKFFRAKKMDGFDQLPDALILLIFNSVSDIKTLMRCRTVSKRFNSLVPQTESLTLRVDCVVSAESNDSLIITILKSFLKSLHDIVPLLPKGGAKIQNSPNQILKQFERIRDLVIELPGGDLRLEKGTVVKYKAEFGKSLKNCVILGFRGGGGGGEGELKRRVVWTISALLAAAARHYLMAEIAKEHREIEQLVVKDKQGEGVVVMDKNGLKEFWAEEAHISDAAVEDRRRTTVPSVRMGMRYEGKLDRGNGVVEGGTLVVVRPIAAEEVEDGELVMAAFGGAGTDAAAVEVLLKSRSYLLEMNSF